MLRDRQSQADEPWIRPFRLTTRKRIIPWTVCLCRRAAPDDKAAGRQKSFDRFDFFGQNFRQQHADYSTMGKQSQVIIFRVVSGRLDFELCLRLMISSHSHTHCQCLPRTTFSTRFVPLSIRANRAKFDFYTIQKLFKEFLVKKTSFYTIIGNLQCKNRDCPAGIENYGRSAGAVYRSRRPTISVLPVWKSYLLE